MDPKHRDRVGFFRICSGRFQRGMTLKTAAGKALQRPQSDDVHGAGARDRRRGVSGRCDRHSEPWRAARWGLAVAESAKWRFRGIPNFAPEILKRVRVRDPLKQKHLRKALEALGEEGVTQVFSRCIGGEMVVGAVGALQFEVLDERMKAEYGLEVMFEASPYQAARWVSADDRADLEAFIEQEQRADGRRRRRRAGLPRQERLGDRLRAGQEPEGALQRHQGARRLGRLASAALRTLKKRMARCAASTGTALYSRPNSSALASLRRRRRRARRA